MIAHNRLRVFKLCVFFVFLFFPPAVLVQSCQIHFLSRAFSSHRVSMFSSLGGGEIHPSFCRPIIYRWNSLPSVTCVFVALVFLCRSSKVPWTSTTKNKTASQIKMRHECCGRINAAEHKPQDNSEIMQIGRLAWMENTSCLRGGKQARNPLFLHVMEKNIASLAEQFIISPTKTPWEKDAVIMSVVTTRVDFTSSDVELLLFFPHPSHCSSSHSASAAEEEQQCVHRNSFIFLRDGKKKSRRNSHGNKWNHWCWLCLVVSDTKSRQRFHFGEIYRKFSCWMFWSVFI